LVASPSPTIRDLPVNNAALAQWRVRVLGSDAIVTSYRRQAADGIGVPRFVVRIGDRIFGAALTIGRTLLDDAVQLIVGESDGLVARQRRVTGRRSPQSAIVVVGVVGHPDLGIIDALFQTE